MLSSGSQIGGVCLIGKFHRGGSATNGVTQASYEHFSEIQKLSDDQEKNRITCTNKK